MDDIFKNSQTLVKEIKDIASFNLTARPFNRFEPENTIWWLIPSTEWPAYKYGKLFFEATDKNIFCGYNLEKGVSIGSDIYNTSLLMDRDWIWNKFIASLEKKDEGLSSILKHLTVKELKSHIIISASLLPTDNMSSFESPDSFLAQKTDFESTEIEFEISNNLNLRCERFKANKIQKNIAEYFKSELLYETSISKVASKINGDNMPDFNWSWIDIYIGINIPVSQRKITAIQLWKYYLEPWEPWLRKG